MFFDFVYGSVNISKIREIDVAREDAVRITFNDGGAKIYGTFGDADRAIEQFNRTIQQLIPCTAPLYNVYDNGDGTYCTERVHFRALCADGRVRSLASPDRFFELADEASNFNGCYTEERLGGFPAGVNS
jgi:hypothetical protein